MVTTVGSLHAQQRRTRNIRRRWLGGYVSDALMAGAEMALAEAYEDAAIWVARSSAQRRRYNALTLAHLRAGQQIAQAAN